MDADQLSQLRHSLQEPKTGENSKENTTNILCIYHKFILKCVEAGRVAEVARVVILELGQNPNNKHPSDPIIWKKKLVPHNRVEFDQSISNTNQARGFPILKE